MRCEDLQLNLALYLDDSLLENETAILQGHLTSCPLCRQALADMQEIRQGLRSLPRPQIPIAVLNSVRSSVRPLGEQNAGLFRLLNSGVDGRSYRFWFLSYTFGAAASVVFGFGFLWLILLANAGSTGSNLAGLTGSSSRSSVLLADAGSNPDGDTLFLSPKAFASTRSDIAAVSPSVNPRGSLIELTKTLVKNDVRGDEMVVVADVYGNGSAQIAEVVEPSKNQNAVTELARALDYDTVNPPFVPATFDQRSDTIRVVLKIQSVDVSTRERTRKRRSL